MKRGTRVRNLMRSWRSCRTAISVRRALGIINSLHIVCPYSISDGEPTDTALINAYRKLHYIYSSQLGTPLAEQEPTFETTCKVSYDPQRQTKGAS